MERSPRPEKVAVVDEVRERFDGAAAVLLTEYRGINVSDMATLRRSITAAGGDYKVYKNTLVRLAIADLGVDGLSELMLGPTALAFVADDAAAVAKALKEFSGTNENLVIKGALLDGELLSVEQVMVLASLPSRDELLSKFAGGLQAPMTKFAMLLNATGLRALIDEQGGVPEPDASPPESAQDGAVEDGAVEDSAVEDGAVEDGAVEDSAVEDSAPEQSDAEAEADPVSDDPATDTEVVAEVAKAADQAPTDEPRSEDTPATES